MGAEIRLRVLVWLALLALLALTIAAAFAPLGAFRLTAGLAIAFAKAGLIYWIFMDLRGKSGLDRLAASVAVFFLTVLIGMVTLDLLIRR